MAPTPNMIRDAYRAELEDAARKPGLVVRNNGDADAALKSGATRCVDRRILPAASRACQHGAAVLRPPMSPTARRRSGRRCKARAAPARTWPRRSASHRRDVTVHVTLLGGGFGRKSKCDFALEAALLSKASARRCEVQWTREDDIRHDFLHTVSAERIEAGLDKSGKVVAWRHRSVGADHRAPPSRPVPSTRRRSSSAWGSSTCRSTSPTSAARTRKPPRTRGSAGSVRCPTSRTPSRCRRWWPRSRQRPGATARTCCWS